MVKVFKKIGQQTHKNKHWRENKAITGDYDIKSKINQQQLYFTKSNDELIENINELEDYILDEFKPFKSNKYKVTVNFLYKKRESVEEITITANFTAEEYKTNDQRLDLNQSLNYSRQTYEGYGFDYEFIGVTDIQIKLERAKPSLGSFNEIAFGLRNRTKAILNFRSDRNNFLRLCITAALYPVTEHASRENKYFNNLVEDWEDFENVFDYLTRIQNKCKNNLWVYRPSTDDNSKVELLEK